MQLNLTWYRSQLLLLLVLSISVAFCWEGCTHGGLYILNFIIPCRCQLQLGVSDCHWNAHSMCCCCSWDISLLVLHHESLSDVFLWVWHSYRDSWKAPEVVFYDLAFYTHMAGKGAMTHFCPTTATSVISEKNGTPTPYGAYNRWNRNIKGAVTGTEFGINLGV